MKTQNLLLMFLLFSNSLFAQVRGNAPYQPNQVFPGPGEMVSYPSSDDVFLFVRGLANVKPDAFVAIFSLTQYGTSTEEVNRLMDDRINQALQKIELLGGVESYIDMISFIPVYDTEPTKKIFSKKTYNELPIGFELKKNLHLKYSNSASLNKVITILAEAEIYDLVRVDYYSNMLEEVKKDLNEKAKSKLQEKLEFYESILTTQLDSANKQMLDGFRSVLPIESYTTWQTYSNSSLDLFKSSASHSPERTTTMYYRPEQGKEYDFVINPVIFEPVIQVMFEVKLVVKREVKRVVPPVPAPTKIYYLITPSGEVKSIF